jgi:hypothetical protein
MSKKDKGRIEGQFVALRYEVMDCPAYIATSHGARCLLLALKRRVPRHGNRAYLSYRMARRELKASFNKVKEWFAELEHYGFIVLAVHGSLGVDGKGKAPHWRLTELGRVAGVGTEFSTKEYLRWDGVLFDPNPYRNSAKWNPQKQNPAIRVDSTPLSASIAPPLSASIAPKTASAIHGGNIETEETAIHGGNISSLTTGGFAAALSPAPSKLGSKPSLVEFGPNDPRIVALDATEKARRSHNGKRG